MSRWTGKALCILALPVLLVALIASLPFAIIGMLVSDVGKGWNPKCRRHP